MRGGRRGNFLPAPEEPEGREDRDGEELAGRVLDAGNGRERRFGSGRRGRPQQKWKKVVPGKTICREASASPALSPPPADCDRRSGPGRSLARGSARLVPRPGAAPRSPPRGLVCGVWVTPATDVSGFSDLGCIFVGSAGIGGAGWRRRRWAWTGKTTSGLSGLNPRDGVKDGGGGTVFPDVFKAQSCVCVLFPLSFSGLVSFEL